MRGAFTRLRPSSKADVLGFVRHHSKMYVGHRVHGFWLAGPADARSIAVCFGAYSGGVRESRRRHEVESFHRKLADPTSDLRLKLTGRDHLVAHMPLRAAADVPVWERKVSKDTGVLLTTRVHGACIGLSKRRPIAISSIPRQWSRARGDVVPHRRLVRRCLGHVLLKREVSLHRSLSRR